jgi:hypothetical protein
MMTLAQQILKEVDQLSSEQQREVLGYARSLRQKQGVAGRELLRFAGSIGPDDLEEMSRAIDADCERVEPDAW